MTPEAVRRHFGPLVRGGVRRYDLPRLAAFNFVLDGALEGGVNTSLALDTHGKSRKGFDLSSWTGLFAPAGTPKPVIDKLNTEVNAVLALPKVEDRLASLAVEPTPMLAGEFTAFARDEVGKWTRLVKEAGIEPE